MRDSFLTYFLIAVIAFFVFGLGFTAGKHTTRQEYLDTCIEKYSDMPANKVKQHCKQLLEFKNESKN